MKYQDFYQYSVLSTLAYVEWKFLGTPDAGLLINAAKESRDTRIPETLANKIFGDDGWKIPASDAGGYVPNDESGFAANLSIWLLARLIAEPAFA